MNYFYVFSSFYYFLDWKLFETASKNAYTFITFWEIPTYTVTGPKHLLNFKISSHLQCYSDSTLIRHLRVLHLQMFKF